MTARSAADRRADRLFAMIAVTGAVMLGAAGFLGWRLLPLAAPDPSLGIGALVVHLVRWGFVGVTGLGLGFALVGLGRDRWVDRRFRRRLATMPPADSAAVLEAGRALVVRADGLGLAPIRLVESPAELAFTHGWVSPQIVISTGLVARLTPAELRAVLRHELHHVARRDPLRLTLAGMVGRAFGFVPVVRALHAAFVEAAELAADDGVVRSAPRERLELASALTKLVRDNWTRQPFAWARVAHAGYGGVARVQSDGEVLGRITRLVDDEAAPSPTRRPSPLATVGSGALALSLVACAVTTGPMGATAADRSPIITRLVVPTFATDATADERARLRAERDRLAAESDRLAKLAQRLDSTRTAASRNSLVAGGPAARRAPAPPPLAFAANGFVLTDDDAPVFRPFGYHFETENARHDTLRRRMQMFAFRSADGNTIRWRSTEPTPLDPWLSSDRDARVIEMADDQARRLVELDQAYRRMQRDHRLQSTDRLQALIDARAAIEAQEEREAEAAQQQRAAEVQRLYKRRALPMNPRVREVEIRLPDGARLIQRPAAPAPVRIEFDRPIPADAGPIPAEDNDTDDSAGN